MESTLDDLKTRRSVRKFKDDMISREIVNKILEAGVNAPTGMNRQSPRILVIQRKDIIKRISDWNKSFFPKDSHLEDDYDPFYGASTLIIVLADKNIPTYVEDGCSVISNILNAAHALGIGACWIHRAKEEFDSLQGKELLKVWNIPENYAGVGHVILGYPADDFKVTETPRKDNYITFLDDCLL